MNFATFERAQVAGFAFLEAQHTGNLDCMRAIAFVLRNRVRAGWGDGSWLSVIADNARVAGNEPLPGRQIEGASDRLLQMIVRDIDDIYLGQDRIDDTIRDITTSSDRKKPALYYCFVNREIRPWFTGNIIRQSQEHAHIGTIGALMLYR